jgi:hypothetical protein
MTTSYRKRSGQLLVSHIDFALARFIPAPITKTFGVVGEC